MADRTTQVVVEVANAPSTVNVRATQEVVEALVQPDNQAALVTQLVAEVLIQQTHILNKTENVTVGEAASVSVGLEINASDGVTVGEIALVSESAEPYVYDTVLVEDAASLALDDLAIAISENLLVEDSAQATIPPAYLDVTASENDVLVGESSNVWIEVVVPDLDINVTESTVTLGEAVSLEIINLIEATASESPVLVGEEVSLCFAWELVVTDGISSMSDTATAAVQPGLLFGPQIMSI